MRNSLLRLLLLLACVVGPYTARSQSLQIGDLVTQKRYMLPMGDGTKLATDFYVPILSNDLKFENLQINLLGQNITIPSLKLANVGTQLYVFPQNGADSLKFPVIFTRTPYNMQDPTQGQIEAVLGYCGVLQDMRGRYASEGVYLPMYSDSWQKAPYFPANFRHPLDTTWNGSANLHQDGYESVKLIADSVHWDWNRNGIVEPNEGLVCNGNIGMFGASALGNTQYQAAGCAPVDFNGRGLKCLFPIVASGEFYHSTGHHNGLFRERIIDGWLRGQVERYNWVNDPTDNTINNVVHTLNDYGPGINTGFKAADQAIAFWTEMGAAHYPGSPFRAIMDMSAAGLAADGVTPEFGGPRTRYEYLKLPVYNLTGWWDIFIDGQIETWQRLRRHTGDFKKYQKIVIGPWAHQTIGSRSTGDMRDYTTGPEAKDFRYKENVARVLGANLDAISIENIGDVAKSELIEYFRQFLGVPKVNLPAVNEWQFLANLLGTNIEIKVPAAHYQTDFHKFFNFLTGVGPLENFPVRFKNLIGVDSNAVQRITIPATGTSIFGGAAGVQMPAPGGVEWDDTKPGGVKAVRFYVVGPINDGVDGVNGNPSVGNYWVDTDTFPVPGVRWEKLYLRGDSTFRTEPPTANEGVIEYFNNPDEFVPTHGGPNMIVNVPDGSRLSQGQMNFRDPVWTSVVLNRPKQFINGKMMNDLIQFTSETVRDSFTIMGFPRCTLYAKTKPFDNKVLDSANTDFIVRVVDVTPDGREMYVYEGAVNARARRYAASWLTGTEDRTIPFANVPSDSILEYAFQMLPIAYSWGKGHRIKVLISSTSYPRYQACPNVPLEDGEFFRRRPNENKTYDFRGTTMGPRSTLNGIAISDQYPSSIEFPVVGNSFTSVEQDLASQGAQGMELTVFPNPASDNVNITTNVLGKYTATIYSLLGNQIASFNFTNTLQIETGAYPRGVYLITVTSQDGTRKATQKLVLR